MGKGKGTVGEEIFRGKTVMPSALLKKFLLARHVVVPGGEGWKIGISAFQLKDKRAVIFDKDAQRAFLQFSGADRPGVFYGKEIIGSGSSLFRVQSPQNAKKKILCCNGRTVAPFGGTKVKGKFRMIPVVIPPLRHTG